MASPPPGFGQPVQLPGAGMQPLGGGPVLQKPKPPLDPQNDMGMMGPRFAGPTVVDEQIATPTNFAPAGGGPAVKPLAQPSPIPMPKPTPGTGQPAKPQPIGQMPPVGQTPPMINAPQNPGYFPMQPGVREIQGPGAQATEYAAGQFGAPQIRAEYQSQGGPQIGELPQASYSPQAVSAGPVNAQSGEARMFDMASFRPFQDAVMSEATRSLDPMFADREAAFRQRMVGQGIQEGTDAFDRAYANFSRERNDAYSSARNQALAQALGAQNQMFGQSFSNAQLAQQASLANQAASLQAAGMNQADRQFGANFGQQGALARAGLQLQSAQMGQQDRQFGANLSLAAQQQNAANALQAAGMGQADNQFAANLRMQGAQLGQQAQLANASNQLQAAGLGQSDRQFGANMGLQYGQLGQQAQLANAANWINQNQFGRSLNEQGRQFNANLGQRESEFGRNLGEGQRQFDANFGFQGQRADMQDLMSLLGYGQQATAFNNAQLAQDQQRAMALFGLIPGLAPNQLDVMGPANQFMQMQQANIAGANARSNGMFGALGQLGGAALGGAAQFGGWGFLSDRRAKTDIAKVGKLDNGLNVYAYRYKHGGPMHIGVMAQEVEAINPAAVAEFGGMKHVNYAEAVK